LRRWFLLSRFLLAMREMDTLGGDFHKGEDAYNGSAGLIMRIPSQI
jgi:hypothetical protein